MKQLKGNSGQMTERWGFDYSQMINRFERTDKVSTFKLFILRFRERTMQIML